MRSWKSKGILSMSLMVIFASAAGCATYAGKHTPEEWLSLSYSGLAAMDQYAFTGSTSMGLEDGIMFQPNTFEGKISNHEQLTIQSQQQDSQDWNPVEVLKTLNQSKQSVVIAGEGTDETTLTPTVTIQVQEEPAATKERWSARLKEQLEQVAGDKGEEGIADKSVSEIRMKLLDSSRQELEAMLKTLKCSSVYAIIIDSRRLIPLKIEESTSFEYTRSGHARKESRHTAVRLQDFDGTAGTVQKEDGEAK